MRGHVIVEGRLKEERFVADRTRKGLPLVSGSDMITQHGRGLSSEITLLAEINAIPVVVATMIIEGGGCLGHLSTCLAVAVL